MFPGLGGLGAIAGGIIQAITQFISSVVAQKVDETVSAEYVSLFSHPHTSYDIVVGSGYKSGTAVGISHLSHSSVYLGRARSSHTVFGTSRRRGRMPYIPMVPWLNNIPSITWYGTTVNPSGSGSGVGNEWFASVRFKCTTFGKVYNAPVSLQDFYNLGAGVSSQGYDPGNNAISRYVSTIISTGMILGPPAIWLASQMFLSIVRSQFISNRDFDLAMTPAGLQQYMRVE